MKIEIADINSIKPYENNPRKLSETAIGKVAMSLKEYGFRQPIVVDKDRIIVAGHTRFRASQKLGLEQVPISIIDNLTPEQINAYRIADNRTAEESEWDNELLKMEIKDLEAKDFKLDLLGFNEEQLDTLLFEQKQGLTDDDEVPEAPEEPVSKLGDLWILGNHRILCGDATNPETVQKLMDGNLADLIVTDPPYNVDYGGGRAKGSTLPGARVKAHGPIMNDKMSPEQFDEFIKKTFENYNANTKELSSIYVFHPDSKTEAKITFEKFFSEYFRKSATLIWNKGHAGLGYADYRPSHEPILYGWKEGKGSHYWCGDKTKKTVLDYSKGNTRAYVHPTQKPVILLEELITNSSKGQDIILDFFGGSGSTLISCEKLDRKCYTMELDPKYCDVIIKRWENFTGKKAVLENGQN